MPLIISGNVVDINDLSKKDINVEQNTLPKIEDIIEINIKPKLFNEPIIIEKPISQKKVKPSHSRTHSNREDNLVVVDGKTKKIGKQSKYLLDMLTIDD